MSTTLSSRVRKHHGRGDELVGFPSRGGGALEVADDSIQGAEGTVGLGTRLGSLRQREFTQIAPVGACISKGPHEITC